MESRWSHILIILMSFFNCLSCTFHLDNRKDNSKLKKIKTGQAHNYGGLWCTINCDPSINCNAIHINTCTHTHKKGRRRTNKIVIDWFKILPFQDDTWYLHSLYGHSPEHDPLSAKQDVGVSIEHHYHDWKKEKSIDICSENGIDHITRTSE